MYGIKAHHSIDFYKSGHPFMFPLGLEELYGNMTARSDKNARVLPDFDHKVLWSNFQPVLKDLLIDFWNDTFFSRPKEEIIPEYKELMNSALGVDKIPTYLLEALHDLGYLPIRVKALPEGRKVNLRVPLYTIRSTMPEHAWIEQYLETQVSAETWKPVTNATTAFEFRRLFLRYAKLTGVDPSFTLVQGHDFSMRGMSGIVDATVSGAAHLMVFRGTDTVPSIPFLRKFYPDPTNPYIGGSIPATEHAVASCNIIMIAQELEETGSWNGWSKESLTPRPESCLLEIAETAFLKWMLTVKHPTGMFSYVSDTYDFWAVINVIAPFLKDDIMARGPDKEGRPGKVVFRPDSGDPVKIVIGDKDAPIGSPERRGSGYMPLPELRLDPYSKRIFHYG